MAKQQYLPHTDIEIVDFEDDAGDDAPMSDADLKSALLVEALNEDAQSFISVNRVVASGNMPEEYVARFPADKYDYGQVMEHLRLHFGGGEYRLRLYAKGRLRKGGNKLVTIAHPQKLQVENNDNTTLQIVMAQMEKMNVQIVEVLKDKNGGGSSRMEMMQELMMMKQVFSSEKSGGGMGEIISVISSLKELGINIGSVAEPEEKGFSHLLEMAAPVFAQALAPREPQVQQYRQNPAPQLAQQHQQQPPTQNKGEKMNMMIAMGLVPLINAAKKNAPPENYAPMVIDNVPEEKLRQFFNTPTGMSELIKIKPEIANYLDWFKLLGEHVKANLGLPSTVDDLYYDEGDDSVIENLTETGGNNDLGTDNLHASIDS